MVAVLIVDLSHSCRRPEHVTSPFTTVLPGAEQVMAWGLKSHALIQAGLHLATCINLLRGSGPATQSHCAHFPSSHWE